MQIASRACSCRAGVPGACVCSVCIVVCRTGGGSSVTGRNEGLGMVLIVDTHTAHGSVGGPKPGWL